MVIIWLESIFVETKAQQSRLRLLSKITFRKSGCDILNSDRMIYFFASFPLVYGFFILMFYFYSFSIVHTGGFAIVFPLYLYACLLMHDKYMSLWKTINLYMMSSRDFEAISQARKSLKVRISDLLGHS